MVTDVNPSTVSPPTIRVSIPLTCHVVVGQPGGAFETVTVPVMFPASSDVTFQDSKLPSESVSLQFPSQCQHGTGSTQGVPPQPGCPWPSNSPDNMNSGTINSIIFTVK